MDEIVKAALLKWPNVPDCYGWLALDARGDWFMRDDRVQQAGPFPQVKGSLVNHDKLKAFIERNYASDEQGRWFFQNGPQKVYVTLEATPLVMGVQRLETGEFKIQTHTGLVVSDVTHVLTDEEGRLFLETDQGLGIVRSPDMLAAVDAMERAHWPLASCRFEDLPARFGYTLNPSMAR
jgi:Protein of unknown function (DUF2946)